MSFVTFWGGAGSPKSIIGKSHNQVCPGQWRKAYKFWHARRWTDNCWLWPRNVAQTSWNASSKNTNIFTAGETNTFMWIKTNRLAGGKKEIYSQGVGGCHRRWYSNAQIIAHSYVWTGPHFPPTQLGASNSQKYNLKDNHKFNYKFEYKYKDRYQYTYNIKRNTFN